MLSNRVQLITVATVVVVGLSLGMVKSIYALSCAVFFDVDQWELELVDVAINGESVDDFSADSEQNISLMNSGYSPEIYWLVEDEESGDVDSTTFRIYSDRMPQSVQPYITNGGEE